MYNFFFGLDLEVGSNKQWRKRGRQVMSEIIS